jgi:hypothetical protein
MGGADKEGRFDFADVTPGDYFLVAASLGGRGANVKRPLRVMEGVPVDVALVLGDSWDVSGKLALEGPPADVDWKQVEVALTTKIDMPQLPKQNLSSPVAPDGTFTISQVFADEYDVKVSGLPPRYYVGAISLGDQPSNGSVALSQSSKEPVRIVMRSDSATVRVAVEGPRDALTTGAIVVLVPDDEALRKQPRAYRFTVTDPTGKGMIQGIPPGTYKLYALDDAAPGSWMNPAFLEPFEKRALPLALQPNQEKEISTELFR